MRSPQRSGKPRYSRRLGSAGRVESLESRTLLNATLTSSIGAVTVTKNASPTTIDLSAHFNDPLIVGTTVVLHTTQGDIPMTLFDSRTPKTVANFLSYVNSGEYDGTVFQRAIPNFILQGGQFLPDQTEIATHGTVAGEPGISNTAGTIAMALSAGPDSATSAWFINMGNNGSVLDNSSDGGPFTVFGGVIYNGMTVASQIVNLPKGQVSPNFVPFTGDPSGGVLPLQNYAGGTITTANYVTLPSVQVVPKLAFSATSDNNTLVVPSISNGVLSLNYQPDQTGVATITVSATDLGVNTDAGIHTVTTAFKVAVGTVLGPGGAKQIRFTDADGTRTTLSLTGPGNADVQFNGTGITESLSKAGILTVSGSGLSVGSIALTGTTAASTLNVAGVGGDNLVEIGSITGDGDLRAISAARGAISGDVTIAGSLSRIQLASATGGTIIVNGAAGSLALIVASAMGEAVNSAEAIASVQSTSWVASADGTSAPFAAPSIGRFTVARELNANVTAGSLAAATAGSITASTWNVSGPVTTITAGSITGLSLAAGTVGRVNDRGTATNVMVNSSGNLTSLSALSLTGSRIEAGNPALDANGIPTAFPTAATITTVTVGRGGFNNSVIGAASLGRLSLGAITSANNGTPFGLAASSIVSLLATVDGKRLSLRNASSAAQVTAALASAGITPNDLVIRIV